MALTEDQVARLLEARLTYLTAVRQLLTDRKALLQQLQVSVNLSAVARPDPAGWRVLLLAIQAESTCQVLLQPCLQQFVSRPLDVVH